MKNAIKNRVLRLPIELKGLAEFTERVSQETREACPDWLERLITYYAARNVHSIDFTTVDATDLSPLPVWKGKEITYLLPDCLI